MVSSSLTLFETDPLAIYKGEGTAERPFEVRYGDSDSSDPRKWSTARKWTITVASSLPLLCISVSATMYSSAISHMTEAFGVSVEVVTLGLSVYQLGFAFGPLIWAPLSEHFGRRPVFTGSFACFFLFTLATALAQNIETMVICRFFAGFFGSSPLATSPAIIGDIFNPSDRGPAMSFYAIAAFGGPVVGPIAGSFLAEATSWRWLFWLLVIFAGISFLAGASVKETYAPVRLNRLSSHLNKSTSHVHRSIYAPLVPKSFAATLRVSLIRPFELLFGELIVLFFSVYTGFIYGLLYGFFGAFPWIYGGERGWSPGIASLPFIGVGVGILLGIRLNMHLNKSYVAKTRAAGRQLPPEARLVLCCAGGVALPFGLMLFAWTTYSDVHWIAGVLATIPFGFGLVAVFLSMTAYLLDAYPLCAASALACTAFARSLAGAGFPLFIRQQLAGMGTQWTLFMYAMVALVLAPVPFLLLRHGERIRSNSKYAPSRPDPE